MVFSQKMPQSFHGTGDIFASVLTGALMRNIPLEKAYALAADFVVESIKRTLAEPNYNWYGVNFEQAFPYLFKRLQKM
jgi:pyridoxine kinase